MAIAADCKSALIEFGGSSPSIPTNKNIMNREEHLNNTFPTKDGKTYIQSLDEFNSKSFLKKLMEEINTPEYKEERIKENKEYLENVSMDWQLGYYVGEDIVHNHLPTLSTDIIHSNKVIQVSEEDYLENERLNKNWFNSCQHVRGDSGDKEKWDLYFNHNKMLEKKYLPSILECTFRLIRIGDMKKFKEGLRNSLWNCDMCSYNIDEDKIEITNDLEFGFTHIKFQYDPTTNEE